MRTRNRSAKWFVFFSIVAVALWAAPAFGLSRNEIFLSVPLNGNLNAECHSTPGDTRTLMGNCSLPRTGEAANFVTDNPIGDGAETRCGSSPIRHQNRAVLRIDGSPTRDGRPRGAANGFHLNLGSSGAGLTAGSVSVWVKRVATPTGGTISNFNFFTIDNEAQQSWVYFYTSETEPMNLRWVVDRLGIAERHQALEPDRFSWVNDQWVHITGTWANGIAAIYVNGRLAGVRRLTTDKLIPAMTRIKFGETMRGGSALEFLMKDLVVLTRPVTAGEAAALCESGLEAATGSRPPPDVDILAAGIDERPGENCWDTRGTPDPSECASREGVTYSYAIRGIRPEEWFGVETRVRARNAPDETSFTPVHRPLLYDRAFVATPHNPLRRSGGLLDVRARLPLRDRILVGSQTKPFVLSAIPESWLRSDHGMAWNSGAAGAHWPSGVQRTPVSGGGTDVSVWHRRMRWASGAAFPSQICAAGQGDPEPACESILARPMVLRCRTSSGEESSLSSGEVSWARSSPEKQTFTARGTCGGRTIDVSGRIDFDGFAWFDVKVAPGPNLTRLWLDIPLYDQNTPLVLGEAPVVAVETHPDDTRRVRAGRITQFHGPLGLMPLIWFGNERVGIQWSTADLKDWIGTDMVAFTPGNHTFTVNFVDHRTAGSIPNTTSNALRYNFGLQATPVKALPSNRRQYEISMATYRDDTRPAGFPNWNPYQEQWNADCGSECTARQGQGRYGLLEVGACSHGEIANRSDSDPSDRRRFGYWETSALYRGDLTMREWGGAWDTAHRAMSSATGCPDPTRNRSFTNFDLPTQRNYFSFKANEVLAAMGGEPSQPLGAIIPGYYLDGVQPGWVSVVGSSPNHRRFTLLGKREMMRRFYGITTSYQPPPPLPRRPPILVYAHASGDYIMAQNSFTDIFGTGEDVNQHPWLKGDRNFIRLLTYDRMRAEHLSGKMGLLIMFQSFLSATLQQQEGCWNSANVQVVCAREMEAGRPPLSADQANRAAAHLSGMLLVHDVPLVMSDYSPAVGGYLAQIQRAKVDFGWDAATKFKGYWEADRAVSALTDPALADAVRASYYTRDEGTRRKILVVVMNNGAVPAGRIRVSANWERLGMGTPSGTTEIIVSRSSYERRAAGSPGGAFEISIPAWGYRAYEFSAERTTAQPPPPPVANPCAHVAAEIASRAHQLRLGKAVDELRPTPTPKRAGCFQAFAHGTVYWSPATGVAAVRGGFQSAWGQTGGVNGRFGFPRANEQRCARPDSRDIYQAFEGGRTVWRAATGVIEWHKNPTTIGDGGDCRTRKMIELEEAAERERRRLAEEKLRLDEAKRVEEARKAKEDADRAAGEAKAREEEAKRAEEARKAKEDADRKAKEEADQKAKEEQKPAPKEEPKEQPKEEPKEQPTEEPKKDG